MAWIRCMRSLQKPRPTTPSLLQQPGYGMGYLVGAVQLEKLIADQALKHGDRFDFQAFMDDFLEAGLIPMDLIGESMR